MMPLFPPRLFQITNSSPDTNVFSNVDKVPAFRHRDGGVFYDRPGMMKQFFVVDPGQHRETHRKMEVYPLVN